MAAGKTTLARGLAGTDEFAIVSARRIVEQHLDRTQPADRGALQTAGLHLEEQTEGRWLANEVTEAAGDHSRIVVDSVRTRLQIERIQEVVFDSRVVYLHASRDIRRRRYLRLFASGTDTQGSQAVDLFMNHPLEQGIPSLVELADSVIDTDAKDPPIVLSEARAALPAEWLLPPDGRV